MEYPALLDDTPELTDDVDFVVTFPDFDWGVTEADSEEHARENALDALRTMIQKHIRAGESVPRPTRPRGKKHRMIRLPALEGAKIELYRPFQTSGITKAELARRLSIPKTTVDRLFDFKNHTRLDQIDAAFRALGKELTIGVADAA
jgi:antitoxin HicB